MITVYVYNIVEDEWDFLKACGRSRRLTKEIGVMEDTGDCFFLAEAASETEFVYVGPKPISSAFQNYGRSLFPYRFGTVIAPRRRSHRLCLDLIKDKAAWRRLVSLLKPYRQVKLISYCASPQFYQLKEVLLRAGLKVSTPQAPAPQKSWTVKFLGSKSGIRQLCPQFLPAGLICSDPGQAGEIAAQKYLQNRGVVIKTNKGNGGTGVLIFRPNDLPDNFSACLAKLKTILGRKPYWKKFPIIVEDLIDVDTAISGGFPDVEFEIKANGRAEMLFHGIMIITKKGEYYGMDVNAYILPRRLKTQMLKMGNFIARRYGDLGYRGHFDVDMIASKTGRLYVSETNTRNTGWTDVCKVAKRLIGPGWLNRVYVLNRDDFSLPKGRWGNLNRLLKTLRPVLYSPQTKAGVIVSSEKSLKRNYLYYTVIGPDKTTAYAYKRRLTRLLQRPLAHRIHEHPLQ